MFYWSLVSLSNIFYTLLFFVISNKWVILSDHLIEQRGRVSAKIFTLNNMGILTKVQLNASQYKYKYNTNTSLCIKRIGHWSFHVKKYLQNYILFFAFSSKRALYLLKCWENFFKKKNKITTIVIEYLISSNLN